MRRTASLELVQVLPAAPVLVLELLLELAPAQEPLVQALALPLEPLVLAPAPVLELLGLVPPLVPLPQVCSESHVPFPVGVPEAVGYPAVSLLLVPSYTRIQTSMALFHSWLKASLFV